MTEGLRARQGSTIREVGGSYKVRPPFLSIFHYPTKSLPPLANMPFETDVFGTQADPAPLFGSRFDARGGFSTSTDPPSCRNARRGVSLTPPPLRLVFRREGDVFDLPRPSLASKRETVGFFNTTTPSTCVPTRGRCFRPPQTLSRVEMRDGAFLHHHHPFGSRFDARGGVFDLHRPSLVSKRETEGFFNTTAPSARVSTRGRCFRPSQTLSRVETRDGGFLQHHHPFDSRSDARGMFSTSPDPLSRRNAR